MGLLGVQGSDILEFSVFYLTRVVGFRVRVLAVHGFRVWGFRVVLVQGFRV